MVLNASVTQLAATEYVPSEHAVEDCEGWWLSDCRGSMAEHWWLKQEVYVLGSTPSDILLTLSFSLFSPHNI